MVGLWCLSLTQICIDDIWVLISHLHSNEAMSWVASAQKFLFPFAPFCSVLSFPSPGAKPLAILCSLHKRRLQSRSWRSPSAEVKKKTSADSSLKCRVLDLHKWNPLSTCSLYVPGQVAEWACSQTYPRRDGENAATPGICEHQVQDFSSSSLLFKFMAETDKKICRPQMKLPDGFWVLQWGCVSPCVCWTLSHALPLTQASMTML